VLSGLVATLRIDADRMRAAAEDGHTTATSVADALVRAGIPFRVAHGIVGRLVARGESAGVGLGELPQAAFTEALAGTGLEADVVPTLRRAATVEAAVEGADVVGGTAPDRVAVALRAARARLDEAAP
jgi:argininosuccinate lyase